VKKNIKALFFKKQKQKEKQTNKNKKDFKL
jgi:hypothetical protein